MTLYDRALQFAKDAHGDQVRKYTGLPYWTHTVAVADTVARYGGTDEMIAAALLHDTVEDTPITFTDIWVEFDEIIMDLVYELTDISRPEDGNRASRKALDRHHYSMASRAAQIIKAADMIDNSASILEHDPKFAKVYIPELQLLLSVMTKIHDHPIYAEAKGIIHAQYQRENS